MQFFAVIGLLVNLATYSFCIFITFKEIKIKDSMTSLPFLLPGKLGKPLLSVSLIMGSCPSYLMPIYVFDYYQCENRNSIFISGSFPVYFSTLICNFIIGAFILSVLLIAVEKYTFYRLSRISKQEKNH